MFNNIPTKVLTGEVRLSYAHLVSPKPNNGNDPTAKDKYSVTLLIPKTDVETKKNIDLSIEAAAQNAQKKQWGGVRPPQLSIPVHDGDGLRQNGTPFGEECRGCWVITANTTQKPQVVSQSNINVELPPQEIYSGMYARVTINFFGYNQMGKRGIGCGLGNVMKTRDGEPLAGGASAASDFAGVGQLSGAAADFSGASTPDYGNPYPASDYGNPYPAPDYGNPYQSNAYGAPPANYGVSGQPYLNAGYSADPVTGQPQYTNTAVYQG